MASNLDGLRATPKSGRYLTPFDTNGKGGSGATLLTIQDLFFGDAISIPTAATNHLPDWSGLSKKARGQNGSENPDDPVRAEILSGTSGSRIFDLRENSTWAADVF
jgi:hypothetical protein